MSMADIIVLWNKGNLKRKSAERDKSGEFLRLQGLDRKEK